MMWHQIKDQFSDMEINLIEKTFNIGGEGFRLDLRVVTPRSIKNNYHAYAMTLSGMQCISKSGKTIRDAVQKLTEEYLQNGLHNAYDPLQMDY